MAISIIRSGWTGTIEELLEVPAGDWWRSMTTHHQSCMLEEPSASQMSAWRHSLSILTDTARALVHDRPDALRWTMVFEYELPRERGRRPDVVLLAGGTILVLEFKDYPHPERAHLDQVAAYARDLRHYHAASRGRHVTPILIPTGYWGQRHEDSGVWIVPHQELAAAFATFVQPPEAGEVAIDAASWLAADYAPLPSLVQAARMLFANEPLPQIRRAQSAGVGDAVETLLHIADGAKARGERHVALVTGVPGAGKTLVGLQFVHARKLATKGERRSAVFLSGNGPLVKVLQHALKLTFPTSPGDIFELSRESQWQFLGQVLLVQTEQRQDLSLQR